MTKIERSIPRNALPCMIAALLCAGPPVLGAQEPLTLARALDTARENNPLVRAAALRVEEAGGDVTQAAVLLVDNPEATAGRGRRSDSDGSGVFTPEFEFGLEQRFEVAGQRRKRIGRARAALDAARADEVDAERTVGLAVARSFYETLANQERVRLAEQGVQISRDLLDIAQRRLDAGVGTPLELNAAIVRFAESRRAALAVDGRLAEASLSLRRLLGRDGDDPLTLDGALPTRAGTVSLEEMLRLAVERRPDLVSSTHQVDAASAAADLAVAESWPDVALHASFGREEGQDILSAGVRIPLSLFNRNQGGRAAANAAHRRQIELRTGLLLAVETEVRTAALLYRQSGEGIELYDAEVLRAQEESLELIQVAAEAGELSIADVLVVQRELLDGLEGYLDARLDLALAGAWLRAATAMPQTTDLSGEIR